MKRDFNLIVEILEYFENRESVSVVENLIIPEYDEKIIGYHLCRMYEAGLLDAESVTSPTTAKRLIKIYPFGLTWEGHEFLDAIRQKGVKNKISERLGGVIKDIPFAVVKALAISLAKEQFGL